VLNPDSGETSSIVSQIFFLMALTIFLLLDGHHIMIATIVHSFDHDHIPIGMYRPDGSLLGLLQGLLSSMFELGIRVAAPLLTLVFLETIAMGFVAKTVPQLNILSLGFPLRILMGFLITAAMAVGIGDVFAEELYAALRGLMRMFAPAANWYHE
jgi:flagellar biosynthetic protein FliR